MTIENNEFLVFNNFLNKQDVIKNNDFSIANKITNKKNLINLIHLHEAAILNALNQHYHKDSIYTYTGPILIAINPFKIFYKQRPVFQPWNLIFSTKVINISWIEKFAKRLRVS